MIAVNGVIYIYALLTAYWVHIGKDTGITMAWVFALAMLANASGHIGIMLYRRRYFPGGLSALAMFPVTLYLIYQLCSA
jgi:hypothetical protein